MVVTVADYYATQWCSHRNDKGAESPPMEKIGKNQEKSGENMAKNHKERGKIRK